MKQILLFLVLFSVITQAQESNQIIGKEIFGDIEARQIGPAVMSGRITDIENHPTNKNIIYVGAAGGGVWKSQDGGVTFNSIFDDHAQSIGAIEIDPNNPDKIIWVGTGETWTRNSVSIGDGLYRSTDGGTNWTKVGFEESERIAAIQVNPENSDEVYVASLGPLWGDGDQRGIYKTTDGGENWEKLLYIDETTGASELVMHPENPEIMYAAFWQFRRTPWSFSSGGPNSGLYKTTDGGENWEKIHKGFPEGDLGRIAVAIAPSNPEIVYAVLETEDKNKSGLWKSTDGGKNWEHLNNDFGLTVRPFYFSRITVDPRNPDIVVKGGLNGSISRDGGKTFKNLGYMHSDIHDITFHNNDSDIMYAATDGGLYRSWNGGTTFEIVEDLPVSQFYHVSVDNDEPYNVYGGLQDNNSWYGPSSAPGGIKAKNWNPIGAGDGFRVLKHPTKNIIYSEMQGADNVWRYHVESNRVKTIQPLPQDSKTELRFNWNAPIAISDHAPDRLYIGSQFLHKSEDMGDTWEIISPDLTTNDPAKQDQSKSGGLSMDNSGAENHTTIFSIAESPLDQNIIWVGTDDGNIQLTTDGGKSWNNKIKNLQGVPANSWVYHIEASSHDKATAYVVIEDHSRGNMKPYVYKTTDYGNSWTSLVTDNIEGFARNIQEDFVNPDLLFLGTEFGLYISINGGKNWAKFENNMPAVAVHYMDIQKRENDLVMGTHGRGIIIIDDITPLRELSPEILEKDVHFFETEPTVMVEESGFSSSFGTETQFAGPNPSKALKIPYYLKKRHTFGKMTMEVQDMEGNTIAELAPGKSKGINIVTWNYTLNVPKMAKGKTLDFGGFTAPRVKAGKYKIVLTKGKESYSTIVELKYDDKAMVTAAERAEQEDYTMRLYNMIEDLAYLVYQVDEKIGLARQVLEDYPKAEKVAKSYLSELEALKKDLVITTGDNYVASADPELREKMAELYSNIASNYGKVGVSRKASYDVIESEFNKALERFEEIEKKEGEKLSKFIKQNNIEPKELQSKEEFLED
ncbi:WD40/YVTN/BNR-like repeat-containing protein [Christiangramia crocea]|uniref:Sortilin N-terminal domain-containing protein n=1 Tax=Christiangramia crocea TaxID=2904124 RepID=A0A9X1UY83_9FLAO|nr:hypothetical protein [Gramella crocea]MCG9972456.1 hypothetical protein [Gramella crocea]